MKSRIDPCTPDCEFDEMSPSLTLSEVLADLDVELPSPARLKKRELTTTLWKVIHALLSQSIVLCNTDHLSDLELYTLLWNETLREEFVICPYCTLHIDMTETGADDGIAIYLKYYASEEHRDIYQDIHPDFKMPEHVEPPRRRDHLIPDIPPPIGRTRVN
jgi:hypothetical protein